MNVYIDAEYFELMSEAFDKEKNNFNSNITSNIRVLYNLLLAVKVNTTISKNDIVKYAKGLAGNKNYSTIRDVIISRAIKSQSLSSIETINEIKDYSAFYFTKETLHNPYNVVAKDQNYTFEKFYEHCNANGFQFDGNIHYLSNFVAPTNAMIIVDPYIFANPFPEKLNLLIEFVELHKANLSEIPFQLTIVTKGQNQNLIIRAFNALAELNNLEIQIVKFDRLENDRYFISNYVFSNTGHPFVLEPTIFNQNFLADDQDSNTIKRYYNQYKDRLEYLKNKIDNQPAQIGEVKYKWSNVEFTNRLFQ